MNRGIVVVVSGFSGAGKGTLMKKMITEYDEYALSVSMTTRQPREGEVDGREYFFTTHENFERLIGESMFIEHARYCDNYYGTPRMFVDEKLAEGKNVLLEIEVQGALQVRDMYPDAALLFVTPPSVEELENRLRSRGTETEEKIQQRLARAKEEAKFIDRYDYLLINDDLDRCKEEMHRIIRAAHASPKYNAVLVRSLTTDLERY